MLANGHNRKMKKHNIVFDSMEQTNYITEYSLFQYITHVPFYKIKKNMLMLI